MVERPRFDPRRCYYCGVSDERQDLKPLGPGRAPVCLRCVTDPAHPEREAAAKEVFLQAMQAGPRNTVVRLDLTDL